MDINEKIANRRKSRQLQNNLNEEIQDQDQAKDCSQSFNSISPNNQEANELRKEVLTKFKQWKEETIKKHIDYTPYTKSEKFAIMFFIVGMIYLFDRNGYVFSFYLIGLLVYMSGRDSQLQEKFNSSLKIKTDGELEEEVLSMIESYYFTIHATGTITNTNKAAAINEISWRIIQSDPALLKIVLDNDSKAEEEAKNNLEIKNAKESVTTMENIGIKFLYTFAVISSLSLLIVFPNAYTTAIFILSILAARKVHEWFLNARAKEIKAQGTKIPN